MNSLTYTIPEQHEKISENVHLMLLRRHNISFTKEKVNNEYKFKSNELQYTLSKGHVDNKLGYIIDTKNNNNIISSNDDNVISMLNDKHKTSFTKSKDKISAPVISYTLIISSKVLPSNSKMSDVSEFVSLSGNNIIIFNSDISNNILNTFRKRYKSIELFNSLYFIRDILKSNMIPKHTLLTNESKNEFLDFFNSDLNLLPRISINEIIIRYYMGNANDIVRIDRHMDVSSVAYRIIVNNV